MSASKNLLARIRTTSSVETLEGRMMLAARIATKAIDAAYFRDTGRLDQNALPANATIEATSGRTSKFSAAAMRPLLPSHVEAKSREIALPTPDGGTARFMVKRTQLLAPTVAAAHPEIATFEGVGIDDPSLFTTFDLTANGFHANVFSHKGSWAVAPVTEFAADVAAGGGMYASFSMSSLPILSDDVICTGVEERPGHDDHEHGHALGDIDHDTLTTGPQRLTVRIAVAANGEWSALTGGTVDTAFAKIVSNLNYAQGIYIREFNIAFTLVSGTNLVYLNSATDPYDNSNANTMLDQNQPNVDATIGSANYDIGHVFTTSGGGVAYVGVVGEPNWKARGVTGNNPQTFNSQFTFAHEMGHQFGSHHTWNYVGAAYAAQRSPANAYEPGPGSTILSYGSFGFPGDFVTQRDDYFHARSIEVITDYVANDFYGSTAGTRAATGNTAPTVNAGINRTIPALTPFELIGVTSDNGPAGSLTHGWEQYDLGDDDAIGIDDGNGPLFRSRPAVASSTRSFPELADILANRSDNDEKLPSVARTADPLTFRLTVRDGVGGVNSDDVDLIVQPTGAAFAITSQNAGTVDWQRNSTQTITWNVAGTTAAAFDAANVAVYISYDNGATFTPLQASTPNDGSTTIEVPSNAPLSTTARIKIKPLNNVFFDINNVAIRIQADTALAAPTLLFASETSQAVRLDFAEPINAATLIASDVVVRRLPSAGAPVVIPASSFAVAPVAGSGNRSFTLTYTGGLLVSGRYDATLAIGSVADVAGNVNTTAPSFAFNVLNGDANRDGTVEFNDLVTLAQNYDTAGRTFGGGNFNYSADGLVNFDDLVVLAQNYGLSSAPFLRAGTLTSNEVITLGEREIESRRRRRPTVLA